MKDSTESNVGIVLGFMAGLFFALIIVAASGQLGTVIDRFLGI